MEYAYVAYTENKKLVKGKISATNDEMAKSLLGYGGFEVVKLKPAGSLFSGSSITASLTRLKPQEVIMFSRQLALLLESGTDIVTSIDLLKNQTTSPVLRKALDDVVSEIRGGAALSVALSRHPRVFSKIYVQAIAAGEQGGSLEIVLRQMADYIERAATTQKKVKSALTYPIMVVVVAFVVIAVLVMFVFPTFSTLYSQFGAKLPWIAQVMLDATEWLGKFGIYLIVGILAVVAVVFAYTRTPAGKLQLDATMLKAPVIGRIMLLQELSRACRTISLLFKVGVPIPEIMNAVVQGSSNLIVRNALDEVRVELIRGEGLFRPMSRRSVFLPLMVQMVGVGEETGNLDNTLHTVARSYEEEADERTSQAIGLIQPAITVVIGVIVAFIALALTSAMYGIYGQIQS